MFSSVFCSNNINCAVEYPIFMMNDSDDFTASDPVPNHTFVESPDSFLFVFDVILKHNGNRDIHSFARSLNHIILYCTDENAMQPHFQQFMHQDGFRQRWIRRLRKVTDRADGIARNVRPPLETDTIFASITHASMVYLYCSVVNSEDAERAAVSDFLSKSSGCINQTTTTHIPKCVKLLQAMIESPMNKAKIFEHIK